LNFGWALFANCITKWDETSIDGKLVKSRTQWNDQNRNPMKLKKWKNYKTVNQKKIQKGDLAKNLWKGSPYFEENKSKMGGVGFSLQQSPRDLGWGIQRWQ